MLTDRIMLLADGMRRSSLSTGSVLLHAGEEPPEGREWCDGREISRSEYPTLFERLGTRFGAGDGVSTFNLPNIPDVASGVRYVIQLGATAAEKAALADMDKNPTNAVSV